MHTTIVRRRGYLSRFSSRRAGLMATAAAGTMIVGSASQLFGVSTSWQNPAASNLWADPANWTNGVPGPDDDAFLPAAFAPIDLGGETRSVRSLHHVGVPLLNGRIDARLLESAGAEFIALSSSGVLEVRGVIGATLGDGVGGGGFDVWGSSLFTNSTIILGGTSTYTGMTELLGEARLEGALVRTNRISVPYSRFRINTSAGHENQLPDTGVIRLERGTLAFAGTLARTETFGALELGPRESRVQLTGPGAGSFVASAQSIDWQPGAIMRLETDAAARLIVRQPPVSPAVGTPTDRPILPYAYAMVQVGPSSFHPSFLTYDHGADPSDPSDDVGLRPLQPATEYTSDPSLGGNVRLTSSHSIASSTNVRSLSLVNAALMLDDRLTIGGNGLSLFNTVAGNPTRITGAGRLSFPGDGVIVAHTTLSDRYELNVPIEAQTITKGGNGGLVLTQPNTIPGGLFIAEGNVRSRVDGALGSGTLGLGGHLHIEEVSQSVANLRIFSGISRGGVTIGEVAQITVADGLVFEVANSLTGRGSLSQFGPGMVHISGDGQVEHLNWLVGTTASELRINGTLGGATSTSISITSHGRLTGAGSIDGNLIVGAGLVAPGPGPARLTVSRLSVTGFGGPGAPPVFEFELNGPLAGEEHDQLRVLSGTLVLSNVAELRVLPGYDVPIGQAFTIIDFLGTGVPLGRFAGLPEGAVFSAGTEFFQITYAGGDGNDVVLTAVIPEPGGLGCCALVGAALHRRRRIRRE